MADTVTERALVAAARCVAHDGIAATTLESIAKEAGVARATLYRHFPNGRRQLFDDLVSHEVGRFFLELYAEIEDQKSIEGVLERGLRHAHRAVSTHYLLHIVLREDPSILEPSLSNALGDILTLVSEVLKPFLPKSAASSERADFLARMLLDYISTQGRWDFDDPSQLRELVRDELLAGMGEKPRTFAPSEVRPMRRVQDSSVRARVIEATLNEVAAGRFNEFTIDSVVRHSQASRATVYRAFPGGRDAMLSAAFEREASRSFAAIAEAMGAHDDLHGCMLAGLTTLWHHVVANEALSGLVKSDHELVRRHLRFESATRTYFVASSFAQPLLSRWLNAETAGRLAEWICRIVVAYWLVPADYLDIDDPASVARFYGRHLAPGIDAMAQR